MALPQQGYFSAPARTNAEAKQAQDELLDAVRGLEAGLEEAEQTLSGVAGLTGQVRVSAKDGSPGVLVDKVAVGGLLAATVTQPGAAEQLRLAVAAAGSEKAIAGKATDCACTPADLAAALADALGPIRSGLTTLAAAVANASTSARNSSAAAKLFNRWQPGSATYASAAFVMKDGAARVFGANQYSDQAQGNSAYTTLVPGHIPAPPGFGKIAEVIYGMTTFALVSVNGDVALWGYNAYGAVGDGTTTNRTFPVLLAGLGFTATGKKVVKLVHTAADTPEGGQAWCALLDDGTVWHWGYNAYGQCANGATTNPVVPSQGRTGASAFLTGVTDIIGFGGSYGSFLALDGNGDVWGVGCNTVGQLGLGTTTNQSTWAKVSGTGALPAGSADKAVKIAGAGVGSAGSVCSAVLTASGKLFLAGYNGHGELGSGTTTNVAYFIRESAALTWGNFWIGGNYYPSLFATTTDGKFYGWGRNGNGQLGLGDSTDRTVPTQITGLGATPNVAKVALYGTYSQGEYIGAVALTGNGQVWETGYQIGGTGTIGAVSTWARWLDPIPNPVFTDVAIYHYSSTGAVIALASDGSVFTAGNNTYNGLNNSATASAVPQQVKF